MAFGVGGICLNTFTFSMSPPALLSRRLGVRVARSRKSAKAAGSRFERIIADYISEVLEDDRVDRMPRRGSDDRGDVMGVRAHGRPVAIECKDVVRMNLPQWVDEAHREAGNGDALVGVVVSKRHGNGDPGSQWVHMELRDFVSLITGQTQEGCYGL